MLSAIGFNLDPSIILSFGNGLTKQPHFFLTPRKSPIKNTVGKKEKMQETKIFTFSTMFLSIVSKIFKSLKLLSDQLHAVAPNSEKSKLLVFENGLSYSGKKTA